jgi:hypothetical protein
MMSGCSHHLNGLEPRGSESEGSTPSGAPRNVWRERLLLGSALVLAGGMWLYSQWLMVPAERAHYAAMGQPTDVGDLYPRWYGTRELLLHHRDPYRLEVSREIRVAYYGRGLDTAGRIAGETSSGLLIPCTGFLPRADH